MEHDNFWASILKSNISPILCLEISVTVTETVENSDFKTCITEKGLDIKHLVMAQTGKFKEETFQVNLFRFTRLEIATKNLQI